jgi:hypothetical protein
LALDRERARASRSDARALPERQTRYSMRKRLKEDFLALIGILCSLIFFYPKLFLVEAAPLTGDHLEQHYPWALLLSNSLKHFQIPFWTPLIHAGFPIAAESQIGIFYLPQLLIYFLLPFRFAYSYMNLIHFFIAGAGMYFYARKMKLETLAAFTAAFVFLFGSAYGGAYYNMTSLKTLAWFPVCLYLFERYYQNGEKRFLILISFLMGMSLVAGYLQVATLTWAFFGFYCLLRIFWMTSDPKQNRLNVLIPLLLTYFGAASVAAPQIYLTYTLAIQSNRSGLVESYAYIGSMSPFALLTLFDPVISLILRGNSLYAGLFSFFLILIAILAKEVRRQSLFKVWTVLTLLAFLLALGQWSPLYVALIKLSHFYSFRIPSKFLVFICFGFSILSGLGMQKMLRMANSKSDATPLLKQASRVYFIFFGVFLFIVSVIYAAATIGKGVLIRGGEWYIRHFVHGKVGHPRDLDSYLRDVSAYVEGLKSFYSPQYPLNLFAFVLILSSLVIIYLLSKQKILTRKWIYAGLVFLFIDLYISSWTDIQQDFAAYAKLDAPNPIVQTLLKEKQGGQMGRLYGMRAARGELLPLVPSKNMIYGIEDIGCYSPLVLSRYHETIGLFGNINDSTTAFNPTPDFVLKRLPLLTSLNVSHILTRHKLDHPKLFLAGKDSDSFLYRNLNPRKKAYFVSEMKVAYDWAQLKEMYLAEEFDPLKTILFEKEELIQKRAPLSLTLPINQDHPYLHLSSSKQGVQEWELRVDRAGFFVLPTSYFHGWKARVNGAGVPILKAYGLFQAIYLPKEGRYQIKLSYHPFS